MIKIKLEDKFSTDLNQIPEAFKKYYEKDRCYCFHATENGKLLALGSITLTNDYSILEDIVILNGDSSLLFGMGKALLNFSDICKVQNVYANNEKISQTLKALQFKTNTNQNASQYSYFLNLENYFTEKCK